jgi:uridine kinase
VAEYSGKSMFPQIKAMVDKACNRAKRDSRLVTLGISGVDSSGKSTLAVEVERYLTKAKMAADIFSIDDFMTLRSVRNANPDQAYGYYEEAYDFRRLAMEVLQPVRSNNKLPEKLTQTDWINDQHYERDIGVNAPGVVIVEGVFIFRREIRDLLDYRIWIDLTPEEALQFAVRRSRDLEYYGSAEVIERRYRNRFFLGQKLHFELDDPQSHADILVTPSKRDTDI